MQLKPSEKNVAKLALCTMYISGYIIIYYLFKVLDFFYMHIHVLVKHYYGRLRIVVEENLFDFVFY